MEADHQPQMVADHGTGGIVIFDGFCNLCSGWARFILTHDPKGRFRLLPLQTPDGEAFASKHSISATAETSIVVLTNSQMLSKSDAVLHILSHLGGLWRVLAALRILPRAIRDGAYDFIAARRYRWFGKRATCMIPPNPVSESDSSHQLS
jgi:predicted DCC family thiol-disulfide oxidoreductase YuxK